MAGVQSERLLEKLRQRLGHYTHLIASLAAVLIFALAIVVLHHLAVEISWHAVKTDIATLPASALLLSLCATGFSYIAFSMYDVVALKDAAPGKVPLRVEVTVGSACFALSNLLGFSYIVGPAIRSRIYSPYGVDLAIIARIVASIWIFFWAGIVLLVGLLLLVDPSGIPLVPKTSPDLLRGVGVVFLLAVAAFLFWLSRANRTFAIGLFRLPLPGFRLGLAQTAVGILDIAASSIALYVLLPSDIVSGFPYFFVVFVGAVALGIASHAPGGIGVFEASMMAGLGAAGRSDVLAALLIYRLIYYVIPFSIAGLSLASAWVLANRHQIGSSSLKIREIAGAFVPALAAGLVLIAGGLLLFSGSLPGETSRLRLMESALPLSVLETSHLLASVAGVMLIVLARGLYRKQYRAWLLGIAVLCSGGLLSLLRGFDWEEAVVLTLVASVLLVFRSAFYRSPDQSAFTLSATWIMLATGMVGLAVWIGLFAYSGVEYSNELWWRFAWDGDAPRFLRACLAAAIVLAGIGLHSLINSSGRRLAPETIPHSVREIIASSTNTEANMHLTGDKRFLISPDETAFIGYADTGRSLIVKGDPVGRHEAGEPLIWQLREMADQSGKRCAFYAVWEEYLPAYLDMGCSVLKIGEVARVDLKGFTLDGSEKKSIRHARSRADREGYRFEIVRRDELEPVLPALRAISDAWLAIKNGEEKAFALGRFDEAYIRNFDHAILRHAETGRIVAFANLFQSAQSHELSLDLMRYDPSGPGFAMDALFAEMLLWGKANGFRWFSLGAAPLSGLQSHHLATFWNRLGSYVFEHGEHFYHFEGLRAYKQKFDPVWSPNYLAIPRGTSPTRILFEINGLISGGLKGLLR